MEQHLPPSVIAESLGGLGLDEVTVRRRKDGESGVRVVGSGVCEDGDLHV